MCGCFTIPSGVANLNKVYADSRNTVIVVRDMVIVIGLTIVPCAVRVCLIGNIFILTLHRVV
jgi:hypothetical protein